ncbi:MAG: putative glycolipid-binding domain-containing protein [Acidobacteriota bacterium]|nr:putative glycolipid-binding domain-containing protein [Acidobacteriota bacterium]MDQ5872046.1 putative glycolipid-binding domain-containing protein [Acidobacteriota bacterium]
MDSATYRYESAGGRFTADLTVDDAGLVTFYPGLARAETD